ncbi:MAG: hypothetical protein KKH01_03025 [Firmicutes bacterium]|nr:hypothetical protein [Bacillota bacterium]
MFQKYDDLFDEQDQKYDKNNGNRYAKKTNVKSDDVEYQRYEQRQDAPVEDQDFFDKRQVAQNKNNKKNVLSFLSIFISFGIMYAIYRSFGSTTSIPWVFLIIMFFSIISVFARIKKN